MQQHIHSQEFGTLNEVALWLETLVEERGKYGEQLHTIKHFQIVERPDYHPFVCIVLCERRSTGRVVPA